MRVLNLSSGEVLARASERGRDASAIMPCVKKDLGNGRWLVDVEHPSYPHGSNRPPLPQATTVASLPAPSQGPGAELKRLLARIGIVASPNCSCNARARQMDLWGPDECLNRLDEISGWLAEEAAKRKLPYVAALGKHLVRRAVAIARSKATPKCSQEPPPDACSQWPGMAHFADDATDHWPDINRTEEP